MFTGIVEELGEIVAKEDLADAGPLHRQGTAGHRGRRPR